MRRADLIPLPVALAVVAGVPVAAAAPRVDWPESSPRLPLVEGERLLDPRDPLANLRQRSEPGNALAGSFDGCPHDYDVLHYSLDFSSIDVGAQTIAGVTEITLEAKVAALASIDLDLKAPLVVSAVDLVGGGALPFAQVGDVLTVTFAAPPDSGDVLGVRVTYGGVPWNEGAGGFGGFWFATFPYTAYSMGVGLAADPPSMGRTWFPCWDRPCDKATMDLSATVDLDKTVVSNGLLTGVDSTATTATYHWSHAYPISTYLMAMSAAPYRVLSDTVVTDPRISVYFHQGYRAASTVSFANVDAMMAAYEARFGPYPYDKFAYMTTPKGDMEHQTCVSHALALVNGTNTYDDILAHEMTHQWFGDMVTYGDWRDVWLSEGFATYGEAVFREAAGGPAAYHAYASGQMNQVITSGNLDGLYDPSFKWGVIAYEKGASVLHMLRGVLDDDPLFWQALRDYLAAHAYGNALTPDFVASVGTTVGQDMSWFFDPWLYGQGHPVYEYGWSYDDLGGGQWQVDVVIRQVQTTGTLFDLPLDFRVQTAGGDFDFNERIDAAEQTVSFVVTAVPTGLLVDPDDWVMDQQLLAPTSIDFTPDVASAQGLRLEAPRPSPFRDLTEIRYFLPRPARTEIAVLDVAGRRVRTLDRREEQAGPRAIFWDRRDDGGARVAAGVYWVRLGTDEGWSRAVKVVAVD